MLYRIMFLLLMNVFIHHSLWGQDESRYIADLEEKLEQSTTARERTNALINLGNACRVYDIQKAQLYIEEALELSSKENDTIGICNAHFSKALYMLEILRDEEKAMEQFEIARTLAKECRGDSSSTMYIEANILMNLGIYYYTKGVLGKSLQYNLDAIDLCIKNKDTTSLSSTYANTGILYNYVGYYEPALKFFYKGRTLVNQQQQRSTYATYNVNLALVYANMKDYAKAKVLVEEAQELFTEVSDRDGIANCHGLKSMIGLEQNNLEEVRKHTTIAFQIFSSLELVYGMSYIRKQQTELAIREKDYAQALTWAEEGLLISQEQEAEGEQMEWCELLIEIYDNSQNSEKLAQITPSYIQLRDSFEQKKAIQMLAITEVKFGVEKLEKEKELLNLTTLDQQKDLKINTLKVRRQNTTIVFLILFLIVVGGVAFLLIRQNRLQNKYNVLNLRQQLLQSQINPHFFFNVLNSLQSSILNEAPIVAYQHHGKFAKLMRFTLNMSNEPTVLFKDELYALQLFIELEQMRTDNKFDFDIQIGGDIDQAHTKVPGMLLQPFIENAIWHGILPCADRRGQLQINFTQQKDQLLQCIIEDNGIGRAQARENKQQRSTIYASKGMGITQNRLQLYEALYKNRFTFEVEDLKDATGAPQGTRVTVQIPIFELEEDV
ncbi:MAG: histidine kinase [Aureispira sp.]